MKRCNIHLPQVMLDALKIKAEKTGRPVADLIRQALVDYLKLDTRHE